MSLGCLFLGWLQAWWRTAAVRTSRQFSQHPDVLATSRLTLPAWVASRATRIHFTPHPRPSCLRWTCPSATASASHPPTPTRATRPPRLRSTNPVVTSERKHALCCAHGQKITALCPRASRSAELALQCAFTPEKICRAAMAMAPAPRIRQADLQFSRWRHAAGPILLSGVSLVGLHFVGDWIR